MPSTNYQLPLTRQRIDMLLERAESVEHLGIAEVGIGRPGIRPAEGRRCPD
jgi:hypothetical protein